MILGIIFIIFPSNYAKPKKKEVVSTTCFVHEHPRMPIAALRVAGFPNTTAPSISTDGKSNLLTGLEPLHNSTAPFAMTVTPSEERKAPY